MASTGSGLAPNAGIPYQHRVSAWFLAAMLLDLDTSSALGVEGETVVKQISYETSDNIDDLKIVCDDCREFLVQIKRSINFSESESSKFYKVIDQFIRQYLQVEDRTAAYVLITSTRASSKVRGELRDILESIRLNDEAFTQNPLSASGQEVYAKYKVAVERAFKSHAIRDMTLDKFLDFSRRVFVSVFDIERGQPLESATIMLLSQVAVINPELVWALLYQHVSDHAKNRVSVNKQGLTRLLSQYLRDTEEHQSKDEINDELVRVAIEELGPSSDKEVLLMESFVDGPDYLIAEMIRFKDDCTKKFRFVGDKVIMTHLNNITRKVMRRCATVTGMTCLLSQEIPLPPGKSIAIALGQGMEDVEQPACAQAYSALCKQLLNDNKAPHKCLHCGRVVSQVGALFVEVDDEELLHVVGTVHKECLRSTDRVLGSTEKSTFLNHFDVELWIRCLKGGQGMFNDLKRRSFSSIQVVLWDSNFEHGADYRFCIRVTLEDGSYRYLLDRGRVHRFDGSGAEKTARQLNEGIRRNKEKADPYCYTSESGMFSNYSLLLPNKNDSEECLECIFAEPVQYSELIGRRHNTCDNYYAPLCMLSDLSSEDILTINDCVVFLTDPLLLDRYLENWRRASIKISDFALKIIENDVLFDNRLRLLVRREVRAIVDPLVDQNGNFVKGVIFEETDFDALRARGLVTR